MSKGPNRMPWRVLAHQDGRSVALENAGEFDEVVCGDWLHVEQMDRTYYWARLGDAHIGVTIDPKTGNAKHITLLVRQQQGSHVEISTFNGKALD